MISWISGLKSFIRPVKGNSRGGASNMDCISVIRFLADPTRDMESFEEKERLENFASIALARCIEWFGPPKDIHWPYVLIPYHKSLCMFDFMDRRYLIFLKKNHYEGLCLEVGHEMYHRVTTRRRELLKTTWIDEMMAFLVSSRLLREQGMEDYAEAVEYQCLTDHLTRLDVNALRRVRLRYRVGELLRPHSDYPKDFGSSIVRIGVALSLLVEWEQLCLLPKAKSLEHWVVSLSSEQRPSVCRVLSLPQIGSDRNPSQEPLDSSLKTVTAKAHHQLGQALDWIGDFEGAIVELHKAVQLDPDIINLHFDLSLALLHMGRIWEAIDTLRYVVSLYPNDSGLHFTLGNYLYQALDTEGAISEFRRAIEINPNHAGAYYYLGVALLNKGLKSEARVELERALTLDRGFGAREVRKALNACM